METSNMVNYTINLNGKAYTGVMQLSNVFMLRKKEGVKLTFESDYSYNFLLEEES